MIKAVIFDKDGVLMITEPIYFKYYKASIKYFGGIGNYTWDLHKSFTGYTSAEKFEVIKKKFKLKVSLDEFLKEYRSRYFEVINKEGIEVPKGVKEFLELLKRKKIKRAVGTGGHGINVKLTLTKTGLIDNFDVIITADDVAKGKPDPETFLLAAKKLGVKPKDCVVVGDSLNDVLGGKSAGMKVIAIVDPEYSEDPALASPDLEVSSLSEVTFEKLNSL